MADISKIEGYNIKDAVARGKVWQVEVTGTLTAGQTSITLSNQAITTNSTIEIFTDGDIDYTSVTVATGSITITFDEQSTNLGVKVWVW